MHAKALVIDGEFVLIGTANIDERSLKLNYETCAAAYSTEFANAMKQIIHEDINCSDEIILSEWRKRPATQRLIENLAALMSPVL
jgi:cardiolipin synthase